MRRLPRDVSGAKLAKALQRAFGYARVRQTGSHLRLVTDRMGVHKLTVPDLDPLKIGLLRDLIGSVASHHRLSVEEVLERLEL